MDYRIIKINHNATKNNYTYVFGQGTFWKMVTIDGVQHKVSDADRVNGNIAMITVAEKQLTLNGQPLKQGDAMPAYLKVTDKADVMPPRNPGDAEAMIYRVAVVAP